MFFGHNLHYMAPFGNPRTAFCMVFQRASFVFSCPGADFWAQDQILDLGSTFWPGDLFGLNNGPEKKWFCDGMILSWQFRGNSKTQMNSIVHRTHLGRLLCLKALLFNYFQGISNFQGNWGTPQKTAPIYLLFPFVGPLLCPVYEPGQPCHLLLSLGGRYVWASKFLLVASMRGCFCYLGTLLA